MMGILLALTSVVLLLALFGALIGMGYALMHDYPSRWIVVASVGIIAVMALLGFALWA